MSSFNYKARDNTGKLVRGTLEAETEGQVADKLRRMGQAPIEISKAKAALKLQGLEDVFKRISTEELVMFNIQLANMINSGLSILSSLEALAKQMENKRFSEILGSVMRSVESGDSFSGALAKHPKVFSHLFVSMVRAGEASGNLDQVLNRYAAFAEAQEDLKQKVQSALFYPLVLILAAVAVVGFIVTFIIPKFVVVFTRAGIALPVPTLMLYQAGIIIRQFWYLIIIALALAAVAVKAYLGTERGKFRFDQLSLKVPVIGALVRKTCISRFARTFSTLITSGVPILQALDIVRAVVNNEVLGRVIKQMRQATEKGERLATTLKVSEEFPLDTVQMISVGEESGNLDGMLNKISDFYDRAINYSIKKLTTILEPAFLVVMGGVVAFIMASMLLPMFDMMKLLRR
ncbi:type II secretion system F family protein [Candidatus Omnitrophota bacterium]